MVLVLKKNFEKRLKDTQRAPEGRFVPGYLKTKTPALLSGARRLCKVGRTGQDLPVFPNSLPLLRSVSSAEEEVRLQACSCKTTPVTALPRAWEAATRPRLQKKSLPKPQLLTTQRETWNTEKSWYGQRATDPKPRSFQTELNVAQAAPRLRAATPAYRSSNTWLTERPSCHLPAPPELPVLLKALGYSSRDTTQL